MNVGAGGLRESLKKIFGQFSLKIADALGADFSGEDAVWASAEINRGGGKRFVHRHQKISGTQDAALVANRLANSFTEGDAGVFNGVMLIDVKVAFRFDVQIERPMARDEIEHVIEESDSGGNFRGSAPVEVQAKVYFGLVRFAVDGGGSRHLFLASAGFQEALDEFEEALHLLLSADADADVAGSDVSAIAEDDFLFGEIGK
jgi:hypothetical protein